MDEREQAIELITATQVATADLYYAVMEENPMLAKLMMDKMKSFLSNEEVTPMERQTVLMRFLEEHTNMDVIHEVLSSIDNSPLKEDYSAIIMEWNYHNTDVIKGYYLAKYDGSVLSLNKENPKPFFKKKKEASTDQFVQAILQITQQLLGDSDEGDDDGTE